MDLSLNGKVALVTGAGSQVGFGKAICLYFAKEGADIIASDIDFPGCQQTVKDVESLGRKALAVKCDITNKAEVAGMVQAAIYKFGQIDILVNNAGGIAARSGPYEKQEEADWDKNYTLNLKGPMLVTQAVFPYMVARKYGKIVNISSDSARMAFPGVDMYGISKGAVMSFTRSLAKQLAPSNINVNSVAPGWSMETNFVKGGKEVKDATAKFMVTGTPLGRGATVMDITYAVAYLASDVSGYITGQILGVSGGSVIQ
jgi:NAD(P)-dependent dehydrogenase (short-subunit alcohol dehydrogenase family)